jgi:AcrR family transcriptional regulator
MSGPGRPRDPSTEDRVYSAAKQELAERGVEGFSMRSVARRAGVARPSLSLRWPTRDALILDALERLIEWPRPQRDASVRAELDAIVEHLGRVMAPDLLSIQLRLIADAPLHPDLYAAFQDTVIVKAGKRLVRLLQRAVQEGDLLPDTDIRWAADALIGVMYMRTIRAPGRQPPSHAAQRDIVDALWAGLSAVNR